jgi:hypothetical protein
VVRGVGWCLALWIVAARAFAAPDAAALEEAKRLFHEGNALRKAGDCERAYVLYTRSRALVPSAPNTINAAYCAHRLGRFDEALELYEELVARFSAEIGDDDRRAMASAMNELSQRVGSIELSANVDGVVVVDARSRGKLPLLAPIRALPGRRIVRVLKDGWATFERTVEVQAGKLVRIDARLEPLRDAGRLRVEVAGGDGASVFVDGVLVGVVPWEGTLAPGEHAWWLERGDVGSGPRSVRVLAGQTTSVSSVLVPLGRPLTISAEPPTAALAIDGVPVGRARWQGRLPLGEHEITGEELGYHAASARVFGDRGGPLRLALALDAEHPRWASGKRGHVFIAALGGIALSPSLGSGAEGSCDRFTCDRGLAFGGVAALRAGYELPSRLSFEITLGYLALGTRISRVIPESFERAPGDPPTVTRYAIEDELDFRALFAAAGASYGFSFDSSWSLRVGGSIGPAFTFASDRVTGSASGGGIERGVELEGSGAVNRSTTLLLLPEIEARYAIGALSFGFGLLAPLVVLAGPDLETGDLLVDAGGSCGATSTIDCAPGEGAIAGERGYGPFVALAPALTVRYAF